MPADARGAMSARLANPMDTAAAGTLEQRISSVGQRLAESIERLLITLGEQQHRPTDLCRTLGVNKDLASKLLIALGKRDPLAVAYFMPGPEALRKLVTAALRAGDAVPRETTAALESAIAEFESLLRRETGGRAEFDALVSSWLPEARQRFEAASRQAAYKGMSGIKGVSTEINALTYLLHPAMEKSDAAMGLIDVVTIDGYLGLRRLRAGTPIHVTSGRLSPPGTGQQNVFTLEGDPVDALSANTLLAPFCSQPTPRLELHRVENVVHTLVAGDLVGLASAVDLFFGEHTPGILTHAVKPPRRNVSLSVVVEIPAQLLVFDVLLHRDVWQDSEPELVVHDTSVLGVAQPSDRTRDVNRLETSDTIQNLGKGVASCRISNAPHHVELLRSVCERMGWDGDAFRCYRVHSEYPIYGSQVHMTFDRPLTETTPAPAASAES
jgi:hypothetical protein